MTCWLHTPALRRHLDDGEPLSAPARAHVDQCEKCQSILQSHQALIRQLKAPPTAEAPFLHARIMNSIRTTPRQPNWKPVWITASIVFVAAASLALLIQPPKPKPVVNLTIPTVKLPKVANLPIEAELENLKADTRNAARALAQSFLPTPP